jgi:hypothetical protein
MTPPRHPANHLVAGPQGRALALSREIRMVDLSVHGLPMSR